MHRSVWPYRSLSDSKLPRISGHHWRNPTPSRLRKGLATVGISGGVSNLLTYHGFFQQQWLTRRAFQVTVQIGGLVMGRLAVPGPVSSAPIRASKERVWAEQKSLVRLLI